MQRLPHHRLRRFARTIMFVAISAFMLQGVLISISQAAAATGTMLEPAVTLSGSVHFHDNLAGCTITAAAMPKVTCMMDPIQIMTTPPAVLSCPGPYSAHRSLFRQSLP